MKALADEAGIQFDRPDFIAFSRPALEAAEFAKEAGVFEQFHPAVFHAYWQEGKNIGLTPVLCEIAYACGMDAGTLEEALYEKRYTRNLYRQAVEAAAMGIKGAPSYVIGNHLIEGLRPWQVFELAMKLNGIPRLPST